MHASDTAVPGAVVTADEIELRFLVARIPQNFFTRKAVSIIQYYLDDPEKTRLREEYDGVRTIYTATTKEGTGVSRPESNKNLSREQYERMVRPELPMVWKTRYFIPYGNNVIQLNIYHGKLAGYLQAEVEFESLEEAAVFTPPSWLIKKPVTDDVRHGNASLAKYGIPPKD